MGRCLNIEFWKTLSWLDRQSNRLQPRWGTGLWMDLSESWGAAAQPRPVDGSQVMKNRHPWDLSPRAAAALQKELRNLLDTRPLAGPIETVGGVDVGFPRDRDVARAAVVVLDYESQALRDESVVEVPVPFPYIPGLLSFREAPAILAALEKIKFLPDVLICDGHGFAHPRRFGIACHLGVLLDRPTIGCAKSILVGGHDPLEEAAGSIADLRVETELIGAAVRTRSRTRPVYVSIGHRVDLASAVRVVLDCGRGFRLPEPVRLADKLASRAA